MAAAAATESYGDSDTEVTVPTREQQERREQQQQQQKKFNAKPGATTYGYVAVHGQRFKNELCRDFAHGHCSRKHCKYLHQVDGEEQNPNFSVPEIVPEAYTCVYDAYGQQCLVRWMCNRPNCQYVHNINPNAKACNDRHSSNPPSQCPSFSLSNQCINPLCKACSSFSLSNQCINPLCKDLHNVNPHAPPKAPPCRDFERQYKHGVQVQAQAQARALFQQASMSAAAAAAAAATVAAPQPAAPLAPAVQKQPPQQPPPPQHQYPQHQLPYNQPPPPPSHQGQLSATSGYAQRPQSAMSSDSASTGGGSNDVSCYSVSNQSCQLSATSGYAQRPQSAMSSGAASTGGGNHMSCYPSTGNSPSAPRYSSYPPPPAELASTGGGGTGQPTHQAGTAGGIASFTPADVSGGCSRMRCQYVHNMNANVDRTSKNLPGKCAQFARTGTCANGACGELHNVNPFATDGAPLCHDFNNPLKKLNVVAATAPLHSMYQKAATSPTNAQAMAQAMAANSQSQMQSGAPTIGGLATAAMPAASLLHQYQSMLQQKHMSAAGIMPALAKQATAAQVPDEQDGGPPVGCGRPNCTYLHNINRGAPREAQECPNFANGRCTRQRCMYAHNANPMARRGAPQCADFGKRFNRYMREVERGGTSIDGTKNKENRPRGMPGTKTNKDAISLELCADFNSESGCARDFCCYIHNVNTKHSVEELCADYATKGCDREKCRYIHNVNPRAGPTRPVNPVLRSLTDYSKIGAISPPNATGANATPQTATYQIVKQHQQQHSSHQAARSRTRTRTRTRTPSHSRSRSRSRSSWRRSSRYRSRSRSYSRSYSRSRTPPRYSRSRRYAKRRAAPSSLANAGANKKGDAAAAATSSPKKHLSQKALLKEQTRAALEKLRSGKTRGPNASTLGDVAEKSSSASAPESSNVSKASVGAGTPQALENASHAANATQSAADEEPGAGADGASKSKKRRYRHASHRKRDYSSDSECDDRSRGDDDDMSGCSNVSRDEWGRVRRDRDRHYSRHRGRYPSSSSRRRYRRHRSPMSHRASRRHYYSSKYSSGDEDEGEDAASVLSDERCANGSGRKEGERERHSEKRKSKARRSSRSRSPIARGGGKRAGEAHADNGGKGSRLPPMVVDKKQKKIVEFFTRKSVKKSAPAATATTSGEAKAKSPGPGRGPGPVCGGNSPNEAASQSKSHKRKISVASPQSPKRPKQGKALTLSTGTGTAAVSSPSAPIAGPKIHPDRLRQMPLATKAEGVQDGNTPEKEK